MHKTGYPILLLCLLVAACGGPSSKKGDLYQWNTNDYSCKADDAPIVKEDSFGDCDSLLNRNHHSN